LHFEDFVIRADFNVMFLNNFKVPLNGFADIGFRFIQCVPFTHATRQGRDFGPVTAFFCFMYDNFQFQDFSMIIIITHET